MPRLLSSYIFLIIFTSAIALFGAYAYSQDSRKSGNEYWGGFLISSNHEGKHWISRDTTTVQSWNYKTLKDLTSAIIDKCRTEHKAFCSMPFDDESRGYMSVVAFSTSAEETNDNDFVYMVKNLPGYSNEPPALIFMPGRSGKYRGKAMVVKRRCAFVWSQMKEGLFEPDEPVAIFTNKEKHGYHAFSKSRPRVFRSPEFHRQYIIYCNDK